MIQKQDNRDDSGEDASNNQLLIAETLRSAVQTSSSCNKEDKEEKGEHMSLFWRVFGGTILSISSLIVITLYNNLSTGISDIRADLNKEREARGDLVKKDDYNTRSNAVFDRIHSLDALKPEIEGLRERANANAASMESVKKDTCATVDGLKKDVATTVDALKKDVSATIDLVKKDETQMVIVKERLTAVESLKKDVDGIEILKDKVASVVADIKSVHDEIGKLQQSTERNRSTELERKASQDLQLKQVEDALKDLQKGLQDCREKLARLEGAQPGATNPPVKP